MPLFTGTLKLSPVLGFLFAGIMLGPTGLGLVSDVESTTKVAVQILLINSYMY